MKKLTLFALVLLMALTVLVLPISANQPVDQLTQMAELVPADAPLFAVIRSDDGMIDDLNAIFTAKIADIAAQIGEEVPDMTLRDGLTDMFGLYDEGESFDNSIRPWLGDHVMLFLPSINTLMEGNSDMPFTIVMQNNDLAAAVAFYDKAYEFDIEYGDIEKVEQEDGSVLYNATVSYRQSTLVTDDLVIIGDANSVVMPGADARRLSNEESFTAAVSALPETEYNALVYVNPTPVFEMLGTMGPMMLGEMWPDLDMTLLAESVGQIAVGMTILQDRSLVMDVAQTAAMKPSVAPVDMSLLDRVPADAALVMEGNGMGAQVQHLLNSLVELDAIWADLAVAEQAGFPSLSFLSPGDISTFITLTLEGTFDINLEDALALMNGDHIGFIRANITDDPMTSGLESGSLMAIDDPAAVDELLGKVAAYITRAYSGASYQDGTLSVSLDALLGVEGLWDMNVTVTDEYLVSGSSEVVDELLNPGDAITGTDGWAFESNNFLAEPAAVFYINGAAIRDTADQLMSLMGEQVSLSDAQAVQALLSIVDSASITVQAGEATTVSRLTITLSE